MYRLRVLLGLARAFLSDLSPGQPGKLVQTILVSGMHPMTETSRSWWLATIEAGSDRDGR